MAAKAFGKTILIGALLATGGAQAQEVVRLGNLKFAHYGAVSYIKEIGPKCGIKVEEKASQAINKGFGAEIMKPYDTPIGSPVRTMVMTEKFYTTQRPLAEKFMRCFVQANSTFIKDPALAEKYVRDTVFKGQITSDDFRDAMDNAQYTYDITPEHIQTTTDIMYKTGVGRMAKPPAARDGSRPTCSKRPRR